MTRRPFDPHDADTRPVELDPVARELERYADLTAGEVAPDLAERVMAGVAAEPTPRRGLLATLLGPTRAGGGPRLLLVGATMALGVLAVVLAGQIAGLLPDEQIGPSPSPSAVEVPTASPSPSQTPTPTPSAEPSRTPRPTRSARPTASDSPRPTATDDDDETETPEPSDDDNSGPGGGGGGGDDNSGPGGGRDDDDGGGSGPG